MELETDDIALENAKARIEAQLGWGDSARWHTQDFESLSSKIHAKTGVQLSVATLKRLWGKVRYDSKPTPTTLNALAQFLDFESWRSFRADRMMVAGAPTFIPAEAQEPAIVRSAPKQTRTLLVIAALALIVGAVVWILWITSARELDPNLFAFSSKKVVDSGVPNTVVFDFDASAAREGDSVFVQQSWDTRLSRQVRRDQKQHTSIYYYPGFFEAKLRINQQVVKEHNLLINTTGWLPLVEQAGTPLYFQTEDAIGNGVLHLPVDKIQSMGIAMQPVAPWVAYYNVGDFGGVKSDDVVFETRLRNDYGEGTNACRYVEIRVQFEGPAILIPLSAKGCVSNISFGGEDGTQRDFSGFGCDLNEWVDVKCVMKEDIGEIYVNGASAARFRLTGSTAKMVEVAYRFQGNGSVDYVRVSDRSGKLFFEDEFLGERK